MANANDPFDTLNPSLHDVPDGIYVISPDDNNDLPVAVRAIRANTAGTVAVVMRSGVTSTLNFAAGETRVGRFIRVLSTNTTATGLEGSV